MVATPSYGQVPRALRALAAAVGFQTAILGPRVALEDSGMTFWPEEVTERRVGASRMTLGSIWKGWTLRPRAAEGLGRWRP